MITKYSELFGVDPDRQRILTFLRSLQYEPSNMVINLETRLLSWKHSYRIGNLTMKFIVGI